MTDPTPQLEQVLERHASSAIDAGVFATATLLAVGLYTVFAGFPTATVLGLGLAAITTAVLTVAAVLWDVAGERFEMAEDLDDGGDP